VFLIALIVLTALAGYHISVLARLDATPPQGPRGMAGRIAGE
jgi:hypothetical protein